MLIFSSAVLPYGSTSSYQQYASGGLYLFTDRSQASFYCIVMIVNICLLCLQKLVVVCLCGGDECDPSKTAVKSSSAAILARILVLNTNYLAQLTSESSLLLLLQGAGFPLEENILLCLVDIWLEKVSLTCISSLLSTLINSQLMEESEDKHMHLDKKFNELRIYIFPLRIVNL